jgi:uncharacterized protein YjbJ (UPF0337 family)
MPVPDPLAALIGSTTARAGVLLDRFRTEAADQVAQLTGRTAGLADEAGDAVGALAETAAGAATRLTGEAADAAGRACDRFARSAGRWTEGLGDRMVRLGEDLTRARPPRR